jgi:hypothetical protein
MQDSARAAAHNLQKDSEQGKVKEEAARPFIYTRKQFRFQARAASTMEHANFVQMMQCHNQPLTRRKDVSTNNTFLQGKNHDHGMPLGLSEGRHHLYVGLRHSLWCVRRVRRR